MKDFSLGCAFFTSVDFTSFFVSDILDSFLATSLPYIHTHTEKTLSTAATFVVDAAGATAYA